jgi:hypothetical protein
MKNTHLSDEDLVVLADGEMPARRSVAARAHLAACWDCRTRMGDLESAIGAFIHAHHADLEPGLPPADGPRALLRARLAEATREPAAARGRSVAALVFSRPWWSYAGAVALFGVAALAGAHYLRRGYAPWLALSPGLVPNKSFTPGAVRSVEAKDICSAGDNDPAWLISASVEHEALQEYGIASSRAKEYQLDYLIPPGLGGTADIHNVWPEPKGEAEWNARAKDQLEDRLRELVCQGKISLPQAQHELATDWIGAYKKYFNTSKPRISS